jgi:hypothetical protein
MLSLHSFAQTETFTTGSFIVNLGATNPNTINNGLKPYGLIYDLIRNYQCPVKWIVSQTKVKDGIDFTYNGTGYRGGAFIIPKEFRTPAVNARITFWQGKGVVGITTVSPLTVDVYKTFLSVPKWTLDKQNGKIYEQFLINAGITNTAFPNAYNWKDPASLGSCDDFFVMPHADPTWATHGNLYNWNRTYLGTIWADCHAVSVLENMFNPANPSQRTNFLSTNGLIPFKNHDKGSPPYINRLPNDPVCQYLGLIDLATTNGSEEIYIPDPSKSSLWRPATRVMVYDPTQKNVTNVAPDLSNVAAALVTGRGFGNSTYGWVTYMAGHNQNNGSAGSVAAQRSFLDFSFFQVVEKTPILPTITSITPGQIIAGEDTLNLTIGNATSPVPGVTFSYRWVSSCGGTFIPASGIGQNVKWVAPTVASQTSCVLSCIVTDNCDRSSIQSIPVKITLPVRITGPTQEPTTQPDSSVIIPSCGSNLSITYNVLDNDEDPNDRPLTLTGITGAVNGTVSFSANGSVTYTPNAGFFGVENLTYYVCNNVPFCDTNTYKITVGDPLLLPATANDAYSIIEDHKSNFNVLSNDGSGLIIMGITVQPVHGKVSININNTIDYLPDTDYSGLDSFTYKVTNTSGYTKTAKVNITVTTDGCSGGTYETVAAYSGTTTFNPLGDAYMHENNPARNYGTCTSLLMDGESAQPIRSILKFNLLSASPLSGIQIPAAATIITSASLALVATTTQSTTAYPVDVHRVTSAWNEGTLCNSNNTAGSNGVTWSNNNFSSTWGTAGGDYNATVEGSTNVAGAGTYNWGITNLVQNWWTTSANNLGMIVKFKNENTGNEVKTFGSREDATASNRPVLHVDWYVPHVCSAIPTREPMAMPDSATTPNAVAVNIATATNDYYPNAGAKTYTILTSPAYGNAIINSSSGVITFTPNTTYNGVDSLTYEVSNNTTGLKDTAFVYINITNGYVVANNDAPVGDSSDAVQVINVRANDTDPDIASLNNNYIINITTAPMNGTAIVDVNGDITYTPYPGFTGSDTLYYSITEPAPACGNGFSDTARLVITVFNKKPVAVDDIKNILPCETVTFNVVDNDTDPENGVLTVTNVSALNPLGAGTVINNNDGTISFTPATGFTGQVTFTYTITDNGVSSSTSDPVTVTIDVQSGVNNPPVAMDDHNDTTYIDQLVFVNVLDNDADPDNNGLANPSITVSPLHGTATVLPNGLISYTPNPGFFGTDSLTYQVCDIVNNPANCVSTPTLCTTAKLFISVLLPDNITVAINDENSTWANTSVSGGVMYNDFDVNGDAQIFTGFKDASGSWINSGSITISGIDVNNTVIANAGTLAFSADGTYTFTPALNFVGLAKVKYAISDDAGNPASDSAWLYITVNYFPKITNSVIANNDEYISYGNAVTGNIVSNDKDPQGDLFTVSSYKYDPDGDGVADANGTIASPVVVGGITTSGLPVANAGTLTQNANGTFTFTPEADFHGTVIYDYTICDNYSPSACAISSVKILILPDLNDAANDPPVAGDDFNVTTMNTAVSGNFISNDYDPNGDAISLNGTTVSSGGAHTTVGSPVTTAFGGTVQYYADGTYTYTPAPGFAGPDSTGYQLCDVTAINPQPLCTTAYLHFLVSAFNSALPIADVNNTWKNLPVSGNISSNDQDPENNSLTVTGIADASSVLQPVNGGGTTVTIGGKDKSGGAVASAGSLIIQPNGSYTFTPANNFTGLAFTQYSICDNGTPQVCYEVSLDITVNNVPQTNGTTGTPGSNITIANDDSKGTIVNAVVSGNVLTNDSDPEGNTQHLQSFLNQDGSGNTIASGATVSGKDTSGNVVATAGTITFNNSGTYTFTPAAGFIGTVTIPYQVCDNGNPVACDEADLMISIVPNINRSANIRPVGTDDFNVVNNFLTPNSSATGNVLLNDIDPGNGNAVNGTSLSVQNPGTYATAHGSITIASNGNYTYTPLNNYTGPDQYVYTLCDNGTASLCTNATLYFLSIQAASTLPINLFNFSGILVRNSNVLNWAAANSINTNLFEVESRTENSGFVKIGSVTAKNNNLQNNYSFVHSNPPPGVNYYRLKIIDKDGKYNWSNVITLKRNISSFVNHVYPNPFKDEINAAIIVDNSGYINLNIYDADGRRIRGERVPVSKGYNLVTVSGLSKIASGIYYLEVNNGVTVIKQKLFKIN